MKIVIDRCHHVDGNYDGGKHLQVLEVREGHSRGQFRDSRVRLLTLCCTVVCAAKYELHTRLTLCCSQFLGFTGEAFLTLCCTASVYLLGSA